MDPLPERVDGEGIVLRRWLVSDAEGQQQAVAESAEHLRPWMSWMAAEPQTLEQRCGMLTRWEEEWSRGGDVRYPVFVDGRIVGSSGLHRRLGPDVLEIGYWIHASFVRQGLATRVAALLTDTALSVAEIRHVEIHHDKANVASAGVPRRLGYRFVGEQPDEAAAPADTGIECIWRMQRSQWESQ
jgi:RimJ/RimL family protein N-acetyltransferase